MRITSPNWLHVILRLLTVCLLFSPSNAESAETPAQFPLHDDGLNQVVQWDHYSFQIHGQRLFVFSGEFHYWRIPVPEIWKDLLEKIKACGFTAFAFYSHWAYHSPYPSELEFTSGAHDFTPLLKIAKDVGLYAIVRPGPYVNAESNGGGFPGWLETGAYGTLRNNDSRYLNALSPFFGNYSKIVSDYLVTRNGSAILYQIENEYGEQWEGTPTERIPNPTATAYMQSLEAMARANGIDVPLMANAPDLTSKSWSKDFSHAGGNVDVYGLDSYPSCWSCNLEECTGTNGEYVAYQVLDYYTHFQETSWTQPEFLPEFQGGSYNPWGGPEGGCPDDIGADFANLFYRDNIAQRITAISLYMMYGGTSWGALAAPVVATSYDYSAPISEDRSLWSKFYETKNLAMFTRVAHDLTVTNRLGNSSSYTTNDAVQASELRNPLTNGAFYVTRHVNSSSSTLERFQLHVDTSAGELTVPQKGGLITLNGHQSKILVTDFAFGSETLLYSTAEVLTYAILDEQPVLVLWVPTGEAGEFVVKGTTGGTIVKSSPRSTVSFDATAYGTLVAFTQAQGMTVVQVGKVRVIIVDRSYAYQLFAPPLTTNPAAPENETVLVQGPYLVRSAALSEDRKILHLTGDVANATTLDVFAAACIQSVSWNNKTVNVTRTSYGSLNGYLVAPNASALKLPALDTWKVQDSLPERLVDYDDSGLAWVEANHTTTANPTPPETLPVLYADDYGFFYNTQLWRARFDGPATGVYLSIQGGTAFGWSAWLNGDYIGSFLGSASEEVGNLTLSFSNATVYQEQSNILLIVHDNTGHDMRAGATNPRGILNATLLGTTTTTTTPFTSWKVAGTAGGRTATVLDPIRSTLNEGGLTAERLGWHLPGFDDGDWNTSAFRSPGADWTGPGIRFYRTVAPLDVPAGLDVSLSLVLGAPASRALRALLFVNGYQYGRFSPWIGHQTVFPVPPGVLDYAGDNVVALAVWSQGGDGEEEARVDVEWGVNYVLESSFWARFVGEGLRPGWREERLMYV